MNSQLITGVWGLVQVTSLEPDAVEEVSEDKQTQQRNVSPPDDGIS